MLLAASTVDKGPSLCNRYCYGPKGLFSEERNCCNVYMYFYSSLVNVTHPFQYFLKVGSFDEKATRFYSAEIIVALEYLHDKEIIHR